MVSIGTGYVHVYTGDGKGKTTAAFGLALRAVGAGLRVYIAQFVKGMEYNEIHAVENLTDRITIKQFGCDCFIDRSPDPEDIRLAKAGLEETLRVLVSGKYQVVILDEATIATHFDLFTVDELLRVVDARPEGVELVITGRYADQRLLDSADLVTEMREVKHYYTKGILSREGIDC